MPSENIDQTVSQLLQSIADNSCVKQTIEAARICDEAVSYGKDGNYEEALQLVFPLVIQQVPIISKRAKQIAIWSLEDLVDENEKHQRFPQVLEYLDQWLHLNPYELKALIIKGEILLYEMGDLEAASKVFLAVSKRYPDNLEALVGLTQIDVYRERYYRAARRLIKVWRVLPHSQWAYPITEKLVINTFESLYSLTSQVLAVIADKDSARKTLLQAIQSLGGYSEHLQDGLASLNDIEKDESI